MLVDSNIHITLPPNQDDDQAVFRQVTLEMDKNAIEMAYVLNLPGLNPGSDQLSFVRRLSSEPRFVSVPCFESIDLEASVKMLNGLKEARVRAIKLHPRLLGTRLSDPRIKDLILAAHSADMVVFLCTYPHVKSGPDGGSSYLPEILDVQIPENAKVVLMHGGGTQLLDTAEWARRQDGRVMIDLSWTLTELWDSSIRFDIVSLCKRFGSKILFGSDFPYVGMDLFQERLSNLEALSEIPNLRDFTAENIHCFLATS